MQQGSSDVSHYGIYPRLEFVQVDLENGKQRVQPAKKICLQVRMYRIARVDVDQDGDGREQREQEGVPIPFPSRETLPKRLNVRPPLERFPHIHRVRRQVHSSPKARCPPGHSETETPHGNPVILGKSHTELGGRRRADGRLGFVLLNPSRPLRGLGAGMWAATP
jgi:hypothetical protein